jgi:hypothetical protein
VWGDVRGIGGGEVGLEESGTGEGGTVKGSLVANIID